jgi:hypothetical protein
MPTIALLTSRTFADLTPEDRLLCQQLRDFGCDARAAVWDDATEAWSNFDLVVIRSCWDYHLRSQAFAKWLAAREATGARIWNPPALVRWNMDKAYLRELARQGVPTIPTVWVEQGADVLLNEILAEQGWDATVVKPRISATARDTWRVSRAEAGDQQAAFHNQAQTIGLLVQPFLPQITTEGEWSFVFFDGTFSHALLKRPQAGDFRVQEEHGGHNRVVTADAALIAQAQTILAASPQVPLYARVDGVILDGRLHLMELELIEPALYTSTLPAAVARFAAAIMTKL